MTLRGRMGLCMPKILNKYARRKSEGFTEAMFLQHIDFYGAIIGFKQGRHIIDSTWECFISSFIYPQKYPH